MCPNIDTVHTHPVHRLAGVFPKTQTLIITSEANNLNRRIIEDAVSFRFTLNYQRQMLLESRRIVYQPDFRIKTLKCRHDTQIIGVVESLRCVRLACLELSFSAAELLYKLYVLYEPDVPTI